MSKRKNSYNSKMEKQLNSNLIKNKKKIQQKYTTKTLLIITTITLTITPNLATIREILTITATKPTGATNTTTITTIATTSIKTITTTKTSKIHEQQQKQQLQQQ